MRFSSVVFFALLFAGVSFAQDTNFPVGPQYLITTSDPMFLHPIATPSISLDAPLPGLRALPQVGPSVTAQPYTSTPGLDQPNLFPIYYGYPQIPVIELTGAAPRQLPANINDTGYVAITDAESLREQGYGVTVAEAASFSRTHKRSAPRVYTNADVRR